MSDVSMTGVSKLYGSARVVDDLHLEVRQGEFLTLLGPSGCGKTTTLRMIAGFVRPTIGRIRIGGEDVTDTEPRRRQIGMVFQDYALFPHLTVAENLAFGLIERGVPKSRVAPRVTELLELIRLPGLGDRTPAQLSGGQQQRVALARAIAHPPRVLLLDEPLGALDLKMREHMQLEVRRIQQQLGLTAVYVTHDQTEAITMSDRIAVMNAGRIEQIDTPETIYGTPRTRFVAGFVGKVNFVPARLLSRADDLVRVETPVGDCLCVAPDSPTWATPSSGLTMAVRPEHLTILTPGMPASMANCVPAQVVGSSFCGSVRQYTVRMADNSTMLVETRAGDRTWPRGEPVQLAWRAEHAVLVTDTASPQSKGELP